MLSLKERMELGERLLGMFSFLGSSAAVEVLGLTGYDFVVIDCQHAVTDPYGASLTEQIRAAQVAGMAPVVRVAENDRGQILKALDSGAQAVIVPQIRTAEEAQRAVDAAFYAPLGTRSSCSSVRAAGYGTVAWRAYFDEAASNTLVFPLIEDLEGVQNVREIAAVAGVGGLFFGPSDLSVAMGLDIDQTVGELESFRSDVYAAGQEAGLFIGDLAWDSESVARLVQDGAQLLACGIDTAVLREGAHALQRSARTALSGLKKVGPHQDF